MAKQRFIKKRKKEILIVIAAIIILGVIYFLSNQQTQMLHEEIHTTKVNSESYVFKEEEYVNLDDKIEFSVKEGTKVGANTLLSKSYKLNTNQYIKEAIKVIDWKLKNKSFNNRNKFVSNLKKLDEEILSLEKQAQATENKEDQTEFKKVSKKLKSAKEKRELMQKSLKYVFADTKTLKTIKKELKSKLNNFDKKLTISNINFSFTGYIYFSTTGYENVLDTNVLNVINNDYLDYIRDFKPEKQSNNKGTTIKIVNNDAAYVCSFVDTDKYVEAEKTITNMKKNLSKTVNFNKVGGYYEYLERRVDIMTSFPKISFENADGTITTGYLVDVYKKDHNKALVICVKDGINNIIKDTRTNYKLYTEQVSAYIIPKRAIVEMDGKSYISVLKTGNFKELVEVKVFKYENGKALLKPSENPNVSENMEVILNPN